MFCFTLLNWFDSLSSVLFFTDTSSFDGKWLVLFVLFEDILNATIDSLYIENFNHAFIPVFKSCYIAKKQGKNVAKWLITFLKLFLLTEAQFTEGQSHMTWKVLKLNSGFTHQHLNACHAVQSLKYSLKLKKKKENKATRVTSVNSLKDQLITA